MHAVDGFETTQSYADDCNIYVHSRRAGERVMASVSQFLAGKLRLKVNEAKSAFSFDADQAGGDNGRPALDNPS